jgi:hypothetical protein
MREKVKQANSQNFGKEKLASNKKPQLPPKNCPLEYASHLLL